jgi:hypothetical protein
MQQTWGYHGDMIYGSEISGYRDNGHQMMGKL